MRRGTGSPVLYPPPSPQRLFRLLFADTENEINSWGNERGFLRLKRSDDSNFSRHSMLTEGNGIVRPRRGQSEAAKSMNLEGMEMKRSTNCDPWLHSDWQLGS